MNINENLLWLSCSVVDDVMNEGGEPGDGKKVEMAMEVCLQNARLAVREGDNASEATRLPVALCFSRLSVQVTDRLDWQWANSRQDSG